MSNKTLFTPTYTYEVTKDGRVFSIDSNWRGYGKRELAQHDNSDGYPSVRIIIGGQRKRMCVHVLLAQMHLPTRPSVLHQVRHLDGNKHNNNIDNLCWGTAKENADDRDRHGRTCKGLSHANAVRMGRAKSKARKLLTNQEGGQP